MKGMDMLAQSGAYRYMTYVGGRGYGKTMLHAALEEQRQRAAALMEQEPKVRVAPAGTPLDDLKAQWRELRLLGWQENMYRNMMGSLQYTPADELRNRLNSRLRGHEPAPAVNTRFWRKAP